MVVSGSDEHTTFCQEESLRRVLACSLGDYCGSQWESGGEELLTMTAMRPSAECTGLATMAFKTGLALFRQAYFRFPLMSV